MTIQAAKKILNRTGAFSLQEKRNLRNVLDQLYSDSVGSGSLVTEAAAGITAGVGTVYSSSVSTPGGEIDVITTKIFIDVTGLITTTTDLDIIGTTAIASHIGQITTAQNGVIFGGQISCLETPATGVTDIDLSSSLTGTDAYDAAVTSPTVLLTSGAAWARGVTKLLTSGPAPDAYLYLINGAAGTVGTYTAGKFIIELWGSSL